MLTRKQRELLMFIHEKMEETGIPPSFDEMKDALELASKSGIHRLITALEERGFIRRLANRARALEVIKLPELRTTIAGDHILAKQKAIGVNKTTQQRTNNVEGYNKVPPTAVIGSVEIPVMGRIAAGVPISAIQHKTHSITMPIDLVGNGEHYALEVKGDSMVEAGIYDGDTVIIRRTSTAINGEIVVALIDDEEATLKRYKREGDKFIALEAANPAYETRYIPPCRISIQGKLVGLFRSY